MSTETHIRKFLGLSRSTWAAILVGIGYALVTRLIFGTQITSDFLRTLSSGFLLFVPFAVGAVVTYVESPTGRVSYGHAVLSAAATSLLFLIGVLIGLIEVFICVLMAAPLFIFVAMVGAVVMCGILKLARRNNINNTTVNSLLAAILIAPYLLTPLETRFAPQDNIRTVDTFIIVEASPEAIWENVVSVPLIQPEEQNTRLFNMIGIPKPREATLSFDGIGGIRDAQFESGLSFIEAITVWEPLDTISFTIELNNPGDPSQPFSMIGSEYFAMIDATYRLERLDDTHIKLHLSSRHRLTTTFNGYGGLWTDLILRDLQDYLLGIVKARAEAA